MDYSRNGTRNVPTDGIASVISPSAPNKENQDKTKKDHNKPKKEKSSHQSNNNNVDNNSMGKSAENNFKPCNNSVKLEREETPIVSPMRSIKDSKKKFKRIQIRNSGIHRKKKRRTRGTKITTPALLETHQQQIFDKMHQRKGIRDRIFFNSVQNDKKFQHKINLLQSLHAQFVASAATVIGELHPQSNTLSTAATNTNLVHNRTDDNAITDRTNGDNSNYGMIATEDNNDERSNIGTDAASAATVIDERRTESNTALTAIIDANHDANQNGSECKPCEFHPDLASQYFSIVAEESTVGVEKRRKLRHLFHRLIKEEVMHNFEDLLYSIAPLNNNVRSNHQSRQAIRIFFGKDVNSIDDVTVVRRYIYGPMAVLETTGLHPKDYRVHPFSPLLIEISEELTKIVRQELCDDFDFDFNFMEIKVYVGKDMFCDENGVRLQDDNGAFIRDDNNQTVGLHNDLVFNDAGDQSCNDTSRGDHPIATFTLGSTRKLVFHWLKKKKKVDDNGNSKSKWEKVVKGRHAIELEDGSIFVLLPSDEIPQQWNEFLYKTQHEGMFSHKGASGVSFGFVFRSVKSTSSFKRSTNCWDWNSDEQYRDIVNNKVLQRAKSKMLSDFQSRNINKSGRDILGFKDNIIKFLASIQ